MEIDLTAFHFLRPLWLVLLIPAILLPVCWFRRNNVRSRRTQCRMISIPSGKRTRSASN